MRQAKPFFRKFTKTWYVTLGGKQINLGPDKGEAFQKYHEIMAGHGRAKTSFSSVAQLLDAYLYWLHENRSQATYDKSRHYLTLFVKRQGRGFKIRKLEPIHVTHWIEERRDWTPSTGNDVVSIVQRAFNWAVKRGHLDHSPIAFVDGKPSKTRRETVYTPGEWEELRGLVRDLAFGDLLDFMWATGCRPLEARTMGARYTRSRLPVKLVYWEQFWTKGDALRREAEVKSWSKLNKEQLVRDVVGEGLRQPPR